MSEKKAGEKPAVLYYSVSNYYEANIKAFKDILTAIKIEQIWEKSK